MGRYIDIEPVHEESDAIQTSLETNNDEEWYRNKPYYKGLAMARRIMDEQPTADVVLRAEVEKLQIEIEALKIANEKMYGATKETKAEVIKEIISIIEQRNESNNEHACGVKSEILSALYRGKEDAYRDIKEILEQKLGFE